MNLFEFQLLKHSATGQSFSENSSDLQAALHNLAGRFFVLIEGVGVDVQCSRWLTVSEQSSNCADTVPLAMNRLAAVWRRLWTFRSVGRSFAFKIFLNRHVKVDGVIGSFMPFLRNT